jgi:hypothetical protein
MSDWLVKSQVRLRDGHKCRDCGMTQEEHIKAHKKDLNVHRIIPGVAYCDFWCVTLCHACHTKKPRKTADVVFQDDRDPLEDGIYTVNLNLYDERLRHLFTRLVEATPPGRMVDEVVIAALLEKFGDPDVPNYCI